jgi:hypothetical protein
MVCSRIEIDLLNPENTLYTFGEPPRTLTDNFVKAEEEVGRMGGGGGRKSVEEEIGDIIRWAKINVDEANAHIQLTAGELDKTNKRLSAAEIDIDGVEAEIAIAASRMDDIEGRTTSTEILLNGDEATIGLIAQVQDTRERISNAGISLDGEAGTVYAFVSKGDVISAINMSTEEITISADKISLDGYVTAGDLEAGIADVHAAYASKVETTQLIASQAEVTGDLAVTGDMHFGGKNCSWVTDKYVVTSVKYPSLARKKLSELSDSDYVVTAYSTTFVSYPNGVSGGNIDYLSYTSGGEE